MEEEGPGVDAVPRMRARDRQVSHGAVWTVGGLATGQALLNQRHGQINQTNSHAAVDSPSSLNSASNLASDIDRYHGRVASALDMDRARKVLEFERRETTEHQKSYKVTWKGSTCVADMAEKSKHPSWPPWTILRFTIEFSGTDARQSTREANRQKNGCFQ